MPRRCAVPGCTRKGSQLGETLVSLHKFPLNKPDLLAEWVKNLGRKDFTPTKNSVLCSLHFLPTCFLEAEFGKYSKFGLKSPQHRMLLKDDAVPTVFEHMPQPQAQMQLTQKRTASEADQPTSAEHQEKVAKVLLPLEVPVVPTQKEKPKEPVIRSSYYEDKEKKKVEIPVFAKPQFSPYDPSKKKTPSKTTEAAAATSGPGLPRIQVETPTPLLYTQPLIQEMQKTLTPSKTRSATSTVTRTMLGIDIESHEDVPLFPHLTEVSEAGPTVSVERSLEVQQVHPGISPAELIPPVLYGTPRRTLKDHPYSSKNARTFGTQTDPPDEKKKVAEEESEKTPLTSPVTSSPFRQESGEEQTDIEQYAEYLPSTSGESTSGSDSPLKDDLCQMKKFVVFEDNLMQLMKFCKECGSPVTTCSQFARGSQVGYRISCHSGHSYIWHSQPLANKQPVGNLLIAASILISGNTYAKAAAFAEMLNLQFISKSVYNKIQKQNVLPVIQETWVAEKAKSVEEVKASGSVVLAGDGRCDSPGHSAKYGSYTLMHADGDGKVGSRKIVSMHLVQVSEVKNSNHMEPEGLERCLKEVKDQNLAVDTLATDQHIMITSNMKKSHKEINHQFDVWHVAKGVIKKLTQAAKAKNCEDLGPWIQSVSNHLWWACASCGGDEQILREKWLSLLHHIVNEHQWSGNVKFHECAHDKMSSDEKKKISWMKPASPGYIALKKVVTNKRLLTAVCNLTKFCHTGELEIFHSMLLKYCPKRQHFQYEAMSARLMLAAIDWNNTRREQQTDRLGNPATSVVFSKRRKVFVLKKRYGKAKSNHMFGILKRVQEVHQSRIDLPQFYRPENLARNIAPVHKPAKEELEAKFRSRFQ